MQLLEFEKPIAELERELEKLQAKAGSQNSEVSAEVALLEDKLAETRAAIYRDLTPWQRVQIARHTERPFMLDYVANAFTDFYELHGDRHIGDDHAMPGGFARIGGQRVVIVGHQKGRNTKENLKRNFGSAHPEGYRKAMRLMKLAEKFGMPVFTFIDTPGAYPGVGAEERGQSEAIGRSLYLMADLRVPIICTVIGEGGSGGALAIAVGDALLMLQYSTYSVISPEGCASILWKSAGHAAEAAETLGITANRLKTLGVIDRIVPEPLGGAHRDYDGMMQNMKKALLETWRPLQNKPVNELLEARFERLMSYGKFKEVASN
jgi:acetyl-CoA carboxylase carboxyl transferase subunit alpha